MNGPEAVREIAKQVGGEIKEMGALPDGSGFAIMSMPLPKDHWLTSDQGGYNTSPMPFQMGTSEAAFLNIHPAKGWFKLWRGRKTVTMTRQEFADRIRAAARYACRASTMNGKEMDFDPDAMVRNVVNGMLGYWTADGSSEFDKPIERTQWCCEGDGKGGHHERCRYSRNDYASAASPAGGA